ncbi:MAG TPA: bifunctional phosphopantothenoylcysteine decarboxylase/phosphopantothenate--cysteine ligase CoaBC [Polyangiaceae bacterium]|jgi:phosphopantothenoylcysteine decarboxylase/phosphopantothenate--cysteine ligase|nr:bifunctional phosphopantothenoylcysteine decarboxylase/phosphopantothenate--cysteine ligase CoaBC [Polyangiaceae bacterium]
MTSINDDANLLLGVSASVAAYKAAEIARLLVKRGVRVQVVMTRRARRFLGAETLSAITSNPVLSDLFGAGPGELHVTLAARAQRMLIAPATADTLARLAWGRADDLLTATALCFNGPLAVAPAMHPRMWSHPATERNAALLRARSVELLGPAHGLVASGDIGVGRLLEPEEIVERVLAGPKRDLIGRRLIVSAGPTIEDIDPVRFVSNRSTGKMGFAIAAQAARRGAQVDLVTGPVALETPNAVRRHDVRSALQMLESLNSCLLQPADALVMTAAVGDFRPKELHTEKLKRAGDFDLSLIENPDLIATLAASTAARGVLKIAFALETGSDAGIIQRARQKLERKGVDLVVANRADEALATDANRAHLVSRADVRSLPSMSKFALADTLLDWARERWHSAAP